MTRDPEPAAAVLCALHRALTNPLTQSVFLNLVFFFLKEVGPPPPISEKPLKSQRALFKGVTLPDHQTEVGLTARPLGVALKAQLPQAEAITKLLTRC